MSRVFARLALLIGAIVMVAVAAAPAAMAQVDVGDLEPSDLVQDMADVEGADGEVDETHTPYNDNHEGLRFVLPDAQPGSGDTGGTGGTGGGDAGAGLAVTGTDVEPIVAISAGLLALGGSALVASRRRLSLFD